MDRNSADPAAPALKTELLSERSWWSPVAFQRSQEPKAGVGEEKAEQPPGGRPCQLCLCLANQRQGRGRYQGTQNVRLICSSHGSQSRMHSTKEGGVEAWKASFWSSDTLCWEQDISTVSGSISGSFGTLNLNHRDQEVVMRTPAGGARLTPRTLSPSPYCLLLQPK